MFLEDSALFAKDGYYYMVSAEKAARPDRPATWWLWHVQKSVFGPWENSPTILWYTYSASDRRWWSKGHGTLIGDDAEGGGGVHLTHKVTTRWAGRLIRPGGMDGRRMGQVAA